MSEIKERISVKDFVEGYNKLTNEQLKDNYIKKHIKTTYVPILSKKMILEIMNEKSVVNEPSPHIDMVVSRLNRLMAVLVLYTDIEPDKKENEDGTTTPLTWEAYDVLKSTGLYEKLLEAIGEDLNELMLVQEQVLSTWHMANTSTEAYVNNLIETASRRFGITVELLLDKLTEILEDETKMKKAMTVLEKAMKKIK